MNIFSKSYHILKYTFNDILLVHIIYEFKYSLNCKHYSRQIITYVKIDTMDLKFKLFVNNYNYLFLLCSLYFTSAPISNPPPSPAMPIAEGADHSVNIKIIVIQNIYHSDVYFLW